MSSSNPYEAGDGVQFAAEVANPRDEFLDRLRILGATDDEIEGVRVNWDQLDDDWTEARRNELRVAPDNILIAHLQEIRGEYFDHTTTEEEAAEIRRDRLYSEAVAEATDRMGGTVKALVEWVLQGEDDEHVVARAAAVYDLEADGQNRTTLLADTRDLLPDEMFEVEQIGDALPDGQTREPIEAQADGTVTELAADGDDTPAGELRSVDPVTGEPDGE